MRFFRKTEPAIYLIDRPESTWSAWGDYGEILVHGMTRHLGRKNGLLLLERTGPFVPSISFPGVCDIIVTDKARREFEARMQSLSFKPVLKARIVNLDWHHWATSTEEPPLYPESGEPEDYILDRPHSEELSAEIGDLWELSPTIVPGIQKPDGAFSARKYGGQPFVRGDENGGYNFVSTALKNAIEAFAAQWCVFRSNSGRYSAPIQAAVPLQIRPPFRSISGTL